MIDRGDMPLRGQGATQRRRDVGSSLALSSSRIAAFADRFHVRIQPAAAVTRHTVRVCGASLKRTGGTIDRSVPLGQGRCIAARCLHVHVMRVTYSRFWRTVFNGCHFLSTLLEKYQNATAIARFAVFGSFGGL
jgi:hypothetical protein